jgi:phosphoglycolate phosphatase-like HAD superfamily hydrolase
MNIDLAFFDIDGTIIWRTSKTGINLKSKCFNYALKTVFGLDGVSYLTILGKKIYGQTDRSILRLTLLELGYSDDDYYKNEKRLFEEVDNFFEKFYRKLQYGEYKRIDGAVEILEMLKSKNIRLGLVTGNIKKHADWKMAGVGYERFFTTGGFGDDGESRDEILKTALSRNSDILPYRICHFGDSPQDITAARNFNLKVVAICDIGGGTHSRDELDKFNYGLVVDSWHESNSIIDYLNS